MVAAGISTRTVKVAEAEPTLTCTVMVVPPGLVTRPGPIASPFGAVTVLAPARTKEPLSTVQVTGAPGTGLLKASVTCIRNGAPDGSPGGGTDARTAPGSTT